MIIAECCGNHKGSLNIAKQMITVAAVSGADVVKFQKRNNGELLGDKYNDPHPCPENSYGDSYGLHRDFLEFDIEQHRELKEYAERNGVIYSCSVFDMTSAQEVADLNPEMVKIPSAQNNNLEMLDWLCRKYPGEIHVSLGMTTRREEHAVYDLFHYRERLNDLVLYACTSGYPVPFEDVCLLEIVRLKESYGGHVKAIGFSGHHLGIAVDIAAWALGAEYIERHFTLDRTWKGTDHAASLEPDGLRKVVRDIKAVDKALTYKDSEVLEVEQRQRISQYKDKP